MKSLGVDNPLKSKKIQKQVKETTEKRYGGIGYASESLKQKALETSQERYGIENHCMESEEIKNKIKQSNLEIYGFEHPMQNKDVSIKTSMALKGKESKLKGKSYEEIHGIDKSNELKEDKRIKEINRINEELQLSFDNFNIVIEDDEYINAHTLHTWKCTKCSKTFKQLWNKIQQGYLCPTCYPRISGQSFKEKEVVDFIKEILPNEEIIENTKSVISPHELDVYIPNKNIAIEYHGLYWHSVQFHDNLYHYEKYSNCKEKGIRLIQIFEDEWLCKKDIVKSKLKQIFNPVGIIDIEKYLIKEISIEDKNTFLNNHHIQGEDISDIELGAFYKNKLISVMTFSKAIIGNSCKHHSYKLNRFCSYDDQCIQGIADKLLSYFKTNYVWKEIFLYVDLRWSVGKLYEDLGFECVCTTPPNYWYHKNKKRILKEQETKELTEGCFKIYDCGNLKFKMINEMFNK